MDLARTGSIQDRLALLVHEDSPLSYNNTIQELQVPPPSSAWLSAWPPRHPSSWCSPGHRVLSASRQEASSRCRSLALFALFDQLPFPHVQILQPGLDLEGLGLRKGRLCFCLQPLAFLRAAGQVPGTSCQAWASMASLRRYPLESSMQ